MGHRVGHRAGRLNGLGGSNAGKDFRGCFLCTASHVLLAFLHSNTRLFVSLPAPPRSQPKQPPPRRPLPLQTPPDLHTSSAISIQGHKAKSLQNHCKITAKVHVCLFSIYHQTAVTSMWWMYVYLLPNKDCYSKLAKNNKSILITCNCTVLYRTFCTILSFNLKYLYFF